MQEKVERVNQLMSGKRLNEFKQRIAKEQQAVADERGTCEAFQRLLWERSAALQRVRAVRGSLVPGMWITEWTTIPAPKDNPEGREGVRVTVRGWRDAMGKVEKDWSAKHGGVEDRGGRIEEERGVRAGFREDRRAEGSQGMPFGVLDPDGPGVGSVGCACGEGRRTQGKGG